MSQPYRPRADSLASQCIAFFRTNHDEHLLLDDITDKFGAVRGNIHTLLKPSVDAGLLQRERNADGDYYYQRGSALTASAPASSQPALVGKPSPRRYSSTPLHLNIDALKVDSDVPYLLPGNSERAKWDPLFDKLAKPGQSVAIPGDLKGALAAAAAVRNKRDAAAGHKREYRVARTPDGGARVWRVV